MEHKKMTEKQKLMCMLEHREKKLTKRLIDVQEIIKVLKLKQ
jgi:hypothetical protein